MTTLGNWRLLSDDRVWGRVESDVGRVGRSSAYDLSKTKERRFASACVESPELVDVIFRDVFHLNVMISVQCAALDDCRSVWNDTWMMSGCPGGWIG